MEKDAAGCRALNRNYYCRRVCSHHNLAASNETNSLKVLYCIIENANKTSADFWVHMRFRFIEQYNQISFVFATAFLL